MTMGLCRAMKNLVLTDKNLCAMLDKAKHNERPTDIVLTGTLREEASAQALGANRMQTI